MSATKTYADLGPNSGSGVAIGKCSALLPNHMQCWRAGDVLVSVINEDQTLASQYQLCQRHVVVEQNRDAQLAKAEAALVAAEAAVSTDTTTTEPQPIAASTVKK